MKRVLSVRPVVQLTRRAFSGDSEYAFEMASSATRFGKGASREVGYDLQGLGITKNVCLMTDKTLASLPPVQIVADALKKAGVEFTIFDDVQVRDLCLS
jgi:hydroxyacid-oxoacid transhydrogenase